jgi:UV DNA damage endonuclease
MAKIGFCCKWIDETPSNPKTSKVLTAQMNQRSTTQTHMRSLSKTLQFEKLYEIVNHNCDTLWRQLEWIALQPEAMRLFRITSDFLPLYTLKEFNWIYADYRVQQLIIDRLKGVRKYADENEIRLCMHPGQFTNLCSDKPEVVKASIVDFEYHAKLAEWMGYGDTWHSSGFAINIHANIRQDPGLKNIRRIIANDLSPVARNLITIENDEYGCGVLEMMNTGIFEDVALVLDTHHDWINTQGRIYIWSSEALAFRFVESWRGMRPLGHFSMPDDTQIPQAELDKMAKAKSLPDYKYLTRLSVKPKITGKSLRTHSYGMWNEALLRQLVRHVKHMDVEIEAKGKNVASRQVYDYFKDSLIPGYNLWDIPTSQW